jgi:hypothetical protein
MRSRQRGATFIGMAIIIAILGFALYAGIRLTPLYLEYMAIARAMKQTAQEEGDGPTSPAQLRNALDRRWTIEDIKTIQPKEIDIRKMGGGYTMRAWYRAEAPFVGNISLVVDFDTTVEVKQ